MLLLENYKNKNLPQKRRIYSRPNWSDILTYLLKLGKENIYKLFPLRRKWKWKYHFTLHEAYVKFIGRDFSPLSDTIFRQNNSIVLIPGHHFLFKSMNMQIFPIYHVCEKGKGILKDWYFHLEYMQYILFNCTRGKKIWYWFIPFAVHIYHIWIFNFVFSGITFKNCFKLEAM